MKFKSFGRIYMNWIQGKTQRLPFIRKPSHRLGIEFLEERTLMSALPAPLVSDPTNVFEGPSAATGLSPQVAIDPLNPSRMVTIATTGSALVGWYSIDAGNSWENFNTFFQSNLPQNLTDPAIAPPPPP